MSRYYSDRPSHHRGHPIRVTVEELIETVYRNGPWDGEEGIDADEFFAAALDCLDADLNDVLEGDSYDLCRDVLGAHVWALIPEHRSNTRSYVAYRALQWFSHCEHEAASARWFEERAYGA